VTTDKADGAPPTGIRTSGADAGVRPCIAVLNASSSSIKFALYEASEEGALLFRGQVENIGLSAHLKVADGPTRSVRERWGSTTLTRRPGTWRPVHEGSWWPEWQSWLAAHSTEKALPPSMG
jgi:poly(3-hydroxyalkanoate) synthetase